MSIKITCNNFKSIKILLENKSIKKSLFTNKKLLKLLMDCNCVYISKKPETIYLEDEEALFGVINANGHIVSDIKDLDYFIKEEKAILSRDEMTDKYSHTKEVESKSFNGLTIGVFAKLEVKINDKIQDIYPIEGTGLFIHYTSSFELDDDIIVVGVENPQVIWYINRYKYLFDENKKYLFLSISEYKTNYQYKWLKDFKGEYIHFGDFDLEGVNIYQSRIIHRLKKCKKHSFLIPDDIYKRIEEKQFKKDYQNQIRLLNIKSNDEKVQKLINFIIEKKITLEQEQLKGT